MRVVVQRVSSASVTVNDKIISKIGAGLLVLAGFESSDLHDDLEYVCRKLVQLRIFDDSEGIMNRSVLEIDGDILAVSQFTLHAKTKKGNRPSYIQAAPSEIAIPLYLQFLETLSKNLGKKVSGGEFGAHMVVQLVNDGPVTIIIDSKNKEL